jgi:hypothetical protein
MMCFCVFVYEKSGCLCNVCQCVENGDFALLWPVKSEKMADFCGFAGVFCWVVGRFSCAFLCWSG